MARITATTVRAIPRTSTAFSPLVTEIDGVDVGGCHFCVCDLLLAARSVAYVPSLGSHDYTLHVRPPPEKQVGQ
jgi:hypothetical protein